MTKDGEATGRSWLILSNVRFGPSFTQAYQARKISPSYSFVSLFSSAAHFLGEPAVPSPPLTTSATFSLHLLFCPIPPSPFPLVAASLNGGFRAHTLSWWLLIYRISQYLCHHSIKCMVFSSSHASTQVKAGSQQRERQGDSNAAHVLLDHEVATQARKETGQCFVLMMLNNMQGAGETNKQSHSRAPVPSPFLLPVISHMLPPKENVLVFTFCRSKVWFRERKATGS